MNLNAITDTQLIQNTKRLVAKERTTTTEILHHLKEIERRRLYSDYKCTSLYDYCSKHLGYTKDEAHVRISAMRMLREYPKLEEKIKSNKISLSNLTSARTFFRQEAPTPKERKAILKQIENTSTRDCKRLLQEKSKQPVQIKESERPLGKEHTELKFAINQTTMAKMEKLKGLLAHKHPSLTTAQLFDLMCDQMLKELDPMLRPSPKSGAQRVLSKKPSNSRYIPKSVQREIWQKANGKCEQCGGSRALEFDHKRPLSMGGKTEINNLRLLCKPCNQRAAILNLGMLPMDIYLNKHRGT